MQHIGKDGICSLSLNFFEKSLIGNKRLHLDYTFLSINHRVAIVVEEDRFWNGKLEAGTGILVVSSTFLDL